MGERYLELSRLVARVRHRWRAMTALRAWTTGSVLGAAVLALALLTHRLLRTEGEALVALWGTAGLLVLGVLLRAMAPMRRVPRDLQIARFIEERCPELEDALVTAVGGAGASEAAMAAAVVSDAAARARRLDLDAIISRRALKRTALAAAAASLALLTGIGFSAGPARAAARTAGVYLFPERLVLEVSPGDARVRAGESLRVVARLATGAAIVPVLRVRDGEAWRDRRMDAAPDGFALTIEAIEDDFQYLVAAAGVTSRAYAVTVLRPPRVERIDLRYQYPSGFGMAPRTEEDGGDIYGPAGTRVQVTVHTDKPVHSAALNRAGGQPIALTGRGGLVVGELTITEDSSYRVALSDTDGLTNPGETEYFIRTLQDRPPDVRIVRPASDRQVTAVEEVSIDARADDDFGVAALDLVYAVRGRSEKAVPFDRRGSGTAVTGSRMLYLEDLGVRPGDFVTYYARARDVSRGKRSSEARSDIFFLEVTPFEEEFVAAESQGMGGGSGSEQSLEDLVRGQKDIITATWNLDRRGRESGARSQDDIRTLARAESDLRGRASALHAQMQRAGNMRRRLPGGRGGPAGADPMVDAIGRAVQAMGSAHEQLQAARTTEALPHEMTALNELLRAQAEIRQRQVQQQASGTGGRGSNRQQQDLSSLFDRELAKQQQTNYETPASRESRDDERNQDEVADRVQELARRQDALARSQQELARRRDAASPEEVRRELERLTREQTELRRQAEELARELQQGQRRGEQQGQQQGQQRGQQGGGGQGGGGSASDRQQAGRELQQAAEEMQGAAGELRRDNPQQASARGSRAAERLRDVEQRMRGSQPDDRRRAIGELQLESQQLADAERQLGQEAASLPEEGDRADRARRRAAEQERLAGRAERLDQSVRQLADQEAGANARRQHALDEAVRELDRSRSAQRMRDAARAERQVAAGRGQGPGGRGQGSGGRGQEPPTPRESEEIARGLDRLADRLGAAGTESGESDQAGDELSRLRQLREELARLDRQLGDMRGRGEDQNAGQSARGRSGRQGGQGAEGGRGGQNADATGAWQDARDLLNELQEFGIVPDAEGFSPGRSAPGTEPWKQDFAKWDELKVQLAAALERAERTAADRVRDRQSRDRLNAGRSQAVPEQYRRLVERYYRALADGERK
ncbi:MAG: hypothetical protein A3G77_06705 [Acidobacteria bacterium RIFCSPLOWO2_12_FULL_68_19]|nr:MAG: hypothetical protein A3G77_06705 [Acidobacteria bacterium RIFCSPLOWO2_12_FULL_68_19]